MSDYAPDISTSDYPYVRTIILTERMGMDHVDLPVELELTADNFNFSFARSDGKDLRVCLRSNGTYVLNMWIASWDVVNEKAIIWFKIPSLLANEVKILYVFWGNSSDTGIPTTVLISTYSEDFSSNPDWTEDVDNGSVFTWDNIGQEYDFSLQFGGYPDNAYDNLGFYAYTDIPCLWRCSFTLSAITTSPMFFGVLNPTTGWDGTGSTGFSIAVYSNKAAVLHIASSPTNYQEIGIGTLSLGTKYYIECTFDGNTTYTCKMWTDAFDGAALVFNVSGSSSKTWGANKFGLVAKQGGTTGSSTGTIDDVYVEITETLSGVDIVGFLFADGFDSVTLNPNKWGSNGGYTISDSKITLSSNSYYIQSTTVLDGVYQWTFGNGFNTDTLTPATASEPHNYFCLYYDFKGGDNELGIDFLPNDGAYTRRHNILYCGPIARTYIAGQVPGSTLLYYNNVGKGVASDDFTEIRISYNEPTDTLFQGMYKRETLDDYLDDWERRCEKNTRCTYFRIYGASSWGGNHCHHDYVFVKKYLSQEPNIDTSGLYVEYEQINPPALEYGFGADVTNINIEHNSDVDGDPYRLSDDIYIDISGIFYSADLTTVSGNLIINFGRGRNSLTSIDYIHYDSGHILDYNASRLSEEETDIHGETYWAGTTTSGWAVIDFANSNDNVGCLMVKAVSSNLTGMVKNFKFQGSYTYTSDWADTNWVTLYTGQCDQDDDWQAFYFVNGNPYRYYRLKIINTYGSTIALQEWKMYEYNESMHQMTLGKLRLKPSMLSSEYIYFPKKIKFYASNDFNNWTTLINETNTYTPTDGSWQEYVFSNINPYWSYKLECIGNWNNNTGKIVIAEWEMMERNVESYTYRILNGSSNDINSIWADSNTTFDVGNFYIVNEGLNLISNDRLSKYEVIVGDVVDLNVL